MAGNKDVNSNLNILGKAIISTLPNSSGSVVTWNSISKELSQRTNSEFISDLSLATQSWVTSQGYITNSALNGYLPLTGGTLSGQLTLSNSGLKFLDNPYGGGGDGASMYISSSGGEQLTLNIEVSNDADDIINLITPSATGLKHNGNTVWHGGNFNPASYVTSSSLNSTLLSYVTVNGVQDINATKTFTVSPIVPNGTLGNHAVNLEQLNTKIGNIQIGGRNLVKQSNKFNAGAVNSGITPSITQEGYLQVISAVGNGNWHTAWSVNSTGIEEHFNEGDPFTVTFWVKRISGTGIPDIYIKDGMGYFHFSGDLNSTDFKPISYSGVWKKTNGIDPYLGWSGTSGTFQINKWKLEKGNKATDWTPAPEDQVADWNQTDATAFNFIKNKPTSLPPTAHTHVIGDVTGLQTALNNKENAFAKNSAFNKNFGTTAGTVAEGNHTHSGYLNQGLNIDVSDEGSELRINPIEVFLDGSGAKKFDGSVHPHRLVYIILSDGASGLSLENLQPKQRIVIFNISGNMIGIKEDIASTQYILSANYKVSVYKIQNSYYSANSAIFYDKTELTMW